MQLYAKISPDLPDGGPYAEMNPGDGTPFGIIEFGDQAYVSVKTDDEARRIIEVAAALIAMRKMLGTPHAFERGAPGSVTDWAHCMHCGMLGDSPGHAEAGANNNDAPETVPAPTGLCGHQVHPGAWALGLTKCRDCLDAENRAAASVTAVMDEQAGAAGRVLLKAAPLPPAVDEDEPAICGSERKVFGGPLYQCELRPGHKGLHAVLTPTGAFVAEWSDDPAAGVHTPSGYKSASVTA